jgi:hypothetical protein
VTRDELVRQLLAGGCVELRTGVFANQRTGQKQPVPSHSEIDEALARHILKYLGLT